MKKQSMAMNQRDKGLLIILLAVIVGFICYSFIISPAIDKGAELAAQKDTLKAELDTTKDIIAKLPDLKVKEASKKKELTAKYEPFFYDLKQERILNKLDEFMVQTNLPVTAYIPSLISASTILVTQDEYQALDYPLLNLAAVSNPALLPDDESKKDNSAVAGPEAANPEESAASPDAVPTSDITIKVSTATYPAVINFIKKLEEMNKTVLIKNVALKRVETGLDGQIVIAVYSLPKLDDTEKDYLKFLPAAALGKPDPFQ